MNQMLLLCTYFSIVTSLFSFSLRSTFADEQIGDLYILSIGVEPTLTAKGARDLYAQDAEYIRKAFVAAEPLYNSVHSRVLNGGKASRKNVLQGLDWLSDSMNEQDLALIFFSAHGDMDAKKGYYISLAKATGGNRDTNSLWGTELNQALAEMQGKVIVLIDTCCAAGVVTPSTTKQHQAAFIVACQQRESSYGQWKRPDLPHGYFVLATCEALNGMADKNTDGIVTFQELTEYLPDRASALHRKQNAFVFNREGYDSIPLTRVDSGYTPQQLWQARKPSTRLTSVRNPFGKEDVFNPNGKEVKKFASTVNLNGDEKDANAKTWNTKIFQGSPNLLDGEWESRWNRNAEPNSWEPIPAQIKSVGDRIYILLQEAGGEYLMELGRVKKDLLVGRYMGLADSDDSSPWVGRIVNQQRIDGIWSGGRWDLRRKLDIVASPVGGAETAGETGSDNPAIDAIFASFDQPGSPGCAVAVAQDGELIYSRGYGYANLDYDIPITPQTVFDVGSVTKQFNAACISMLALEGKLSLDDNVRKWLPELPEYERPITLRHMLHHTSGLRDYLNLFPLAGRGSYYPISHGQILAMMSRQRALISPPGERYRYSNTAYMLLAQVLERAGGRSLGQMSQEHIFDPLGMEGSFMYENLEEIIPRRATGYDRDAEGRPRIVHNYNFDVTGDGQLYTTVEDLLRWDDYLHGDEKPEIYDLMLTEGHLNNGDPVGYAQGISLGEYRGLRTVGHGGSSWGFRTQLVRYLEPGLSIAISGNADYVNTGRLAQQVADHYLADQLGPKGDPPRRGRGGRRQRNATPTTAPSLTADQLQQLTGDFFSPELDATYRIAVEDGGLVVRIEQEPPLSVTPLADDELAINSRGQGMSGSPRATLQVERNAEGRVTGFRLSSGSERGIVFARR